MPAGEPSNLQFSGVTSNSSNITWGPILHLARHSIIRFYQIKLTCILANGSYSVLGPFKIIQNSSNETSFHYLLDTVLFPKTVYNLTLVGCSGGGCGPNTNTSFETLEMGEFQRILNIVDDLFLLVLHIKFDELVSGRLYTRVYYIQHFLLTFFSTAPSGFPLNSTNVNKNERGQLIIYFQDINPMAKRGVVTKYLVEYTKINHTWDEVDSLPKIQLVALEEDEVDQGSFKSYGSPHRRRLRRSEMEEVLVENKTTKDDGTVWYSTRIINLENFTEYKVRFSGKTHAGFGPFSQYVIYKTPQYGK